MKFALALILCSYTAGTCLPPYIYPTKFEDQYDCFIEGYKQSMIKMEEIGREILTSMKFILDLYALNIFQKIIQNRIPNP